MKHTLLLALLVPLCACAPEVYVKNRPAGGERRRVAVLPFKDAPGQAGTGELAHEAFSTSMLALESYDIVDRSVLDKLMAEQKLGQSGAVDPEKAVELGKLLGADAVVVGAVTEYNHRNMLMFPPAKVSITARMIDTQTGLVEWSAQDSVGGAKRWLLFVPPITGIGILATPLSPSAEDQVQRSAKRISRSLSKRLHQPAAQ